MIRAPSATKASTSADSSVRAREGTDGRIRLALELMRRHSGRALAVGEIAGRVGLSASRFQHVFMLKRGRSFRAELRDIRLLRAETLLRDSNLLVKEVAALCGYESVPTFSRIFRKRFGRAPSRCRRS